MLPSYKLVVFHVAANDLPRGMGVERVLEEYQTLVTRVWKSNPVAHVILSGVLPRAQNDFPGSRDRPTREPRKLLILPRK